MPPLPLLLLALAAAPPPDKWDQRVAALVAKMTIEEKASQLESQSAAIPRLGISAYNYDTECNSGIGVGYPQNINMAATWNRSLVFAAGRGTGMMLRAYSQGNASARLSCWSPMMVNFHSSQ